MVTKVILVVVGFFLLWFLFHRPESLLRLYAFQISSTVLGLLFSVARALFFGAIVYYLFVIYGYFGRISSFADIITLVSSSYKELGHPAFYGLVVGALVGLFALTTGPMSAHPRSGDREPLEGRGEVPYHYTPVRRPEVRGVRDWFRRNFIDRFRRR